MSPLLHLASTSQFREFTFIRGHWLQSKTDGNLHKTQHLNQMFLQSWRFECWMLLWMLFVYIWVQQITGKWPTIDHRSVTNANETFSILLKKQTFWNKMEAWRLERQRITHLVAQGFGFNLRENGQKSDAISQVHVHTRQRNQGLKEASTGQWLVAPPDHVMAPFGLSLVITSDFRRPDGKWRHQKRKWIMLKTCSTWTAF